MTKYTPGNGQGKDAECELFGSDPALFASVLDAFQCENENELLKPVTYATQKAARVAKENRKDMEVVERRANPHEVRAVFYYCSHPNKLAKPGKKFPRAEFLAVAYVNDAKGRYSFHPVVKPLKWDVGGQEFEHVAVMNERLTLRCPSCTVQVYIRAHDHAWVHSYPDSEAGADTTISRKMRFDTQKYSVAYDDSEPSPVESYQLMVDLPGWEDTTKRALPMLPKLSNSLTRYYSKPVVIEKGNGLDSQKRHYETERCAVALAPVQLLTGESVEQSEVPGVSFNRRLK